MKLTGLPLSIGIFLIFFWVGFGFAQSPVFKVISTEEGLPSSEVYSVVQDDEGYIWGATDRGLFCYNGKTTKVFTTKDGLPSNVVYKMFKDPKGRIWMAASNNHLVYVEKGKIHTIPANKEISRITEAESHEIANFAMDRNGNLVLGTYGHGLIRIFGDDFNRVETTELTSHIEIFDVNSESLAAATPGGTKFSFMDSSQYVMRTTIHEGATTRRFTTHVVRECFSNNKRLIGIRNHKGERIIFYCNLLIRYSAHHKPEFSLLNATFLFAKNDFKKGVWLGTLDQGLLYYPEGDLSASPQTYFADKAVTDLMYDHEGGMWLSTLNSGLLYVPNHSLKDYELGEEGIIGLDRVSNKLYGSSVHGLFSFDRNYHIEEKNWTELNVIKGTSCRFYPWKGKVMMGAHQSILFGENFEDVEKFYVLNYGSMTGHLLSTGNDSYLFSVGYNFLYRYQDGRVRDKIKFPATANVMRKIHTGAIWIGSDQGIYQYKGKNKIFRLFPQIDQLSGMVTAIEESDKGKTIVISTLQNGIVCIRNNQIVIICEEDGLLSDLCNDVVFRGEREVWVATNKGVSRVRWRSDDLSDYTLMNLTTENGLASNEVEYIEYFTDRVWIGTKKGLYSLEVDAELLNSTAPFIHLKEFRVGDQLFEMKQGLQVEWDQRSFSFLFDVLSFQNSSKNALKYRIPGVVEDYTDVQGDLLTLNNLSPGVYTIEVLGVNNDGVVSEKPLVFSFEILPPFYATWWFRTLMALSFLLLFYLFIRWRFSLQRKKDLERMNVERQLSSSQLTALRSQMNPHFIFNAFNGIQRYVLQKDKMDTYRYVNKFSTLIREVLEQSAQNYISIEKEVDMLRNYVEIESLRFDNKFNFVLEVHVPEKWMDQEIPAMIVQPFVENAIWHGLMPLDERQGELILRFTLKAHLLMVEVIDNGIGREQSAQIKKKAKASSMGLRLIEERIELVNTLQPNETVHWSIEDLIDKEGESEGTKVTILIPMAKDV
jgi:ligand-binding sensor domain-containing protein